MKSLGWKTEFKESKNEKLIPVVDGVHLHSVYNPLKEAESFASQNKETIAQKNAVLVFGLGLGYHVNEIEVQMRKVHGEQYLLWIIEPNIDVYQKALKEGLIKPSKNLRISCSNEVEIFFKDIALMNFLSMSPSVVPHPASFNLYNHFFKSFMTYKANRRSNSFSKFINDHDLQNHIQANFEDNSIEDIWEQTRSRKNLNEYDFLLQGLEAVIQQGSSEATNE